MRWNGIFQAPPPPRPQPYGGHHHHGPKFPEFGIITGQPVRSTVRGLNGSNLPHYGLNLIPLLDHAILSGYLFFDENKEKDARSGDMNILSVKQIRFWEKFAEKADPVFQSIDDESSYGELDYADLDVAFVAFDHFLGSYGADYEQIRQRQEHSGQTQTA